MRWKMIQQQSNFFRALAEQSAAQAGAMLGQANHGELRGLGGISSTLYHRHIPQPTTLGKMRSEVEDWLKDWKD